MSEKNEENEKIVGVIYALPRNLVNRFFINKKNVFIKFHTYERLPITLQICSKLLFYVSHSKKEVIGEANIRDIRLMTTEEAIRKYPKKMFLSSKELRAYAKGRENKKALVFILSNIRRYGKPVYYDHPLTMAGEYISKKKYEEINQKK
ncbi:MAG: DUF365 domain-containing protein [Nanoarchaeota archaeon]|nr:DUF365 domain-containing protein [Nanoarchaeota archaeon]MCG2717548.1 DUF365 domain-containing protein [Nanoarchaeota archaeon]